MNTHFVRFEKFIIDGLFDDLIYVENLRIIRRDYPSRGYMHSILQFYFN